MTADCEKVKGVEQTRGNILIRELSDLSTLNRTRENLDRLEILLIDYLACTVSTAKKGGVTSSPLSSDGVIGMGAWLALRSSAGDYDDIDWTVGTHPGSVVWSTVFSICLLHEKARENFTEAALVGFRTGASMASFLGDGHRSQWHVTGTAGAFASASAASVAFGYSQTVHQKALRLAGANIGATTLAPRQRDGAARFNRSAATTLGTTAAMAAADGAVAVENLWDGPYGLLAMFSASDYPAGARLTVDGISTTSLRLFPTTGFVQSVVLATTLLAQRHSSELESLNVYVPEAAISWLDGSRGGFWWDVKGAVAAAWSSQDPTDLTPTSDYLDRIHVIPSSLPIGAASVEIKTSSGYEIETISTPPGTDFDDPLVVEWMNAKWRALVGDQLSEVQGISKALIAGSSSLEHWNRVKRLIGSLVQPNLPVGR
ncbi:MAG: MmgE/PrpD family protein [Candidatus Nanopelagicaceae bacterium]|nr:MmgE/PrpD family protein [Candidatus Nanopelagicaceae bacterium]